MLLGIIIIIVGVVVYNLINSTNKNPEVSIEETLSNINPDKALIVIVIVIILGFSWVGGFWEG